MDKGIYCLIFHNPACSLYTGALGRIPFEAGWHIYVGSALGSGGLQRLERHVGLAADHNRNPKWHVDYLLTDSQFQLSAAVFAFTTDKLECKLASALGGSSVARFGCSDCRCHSHLFFRDCDPREEITMAFRELGLEPSIKTIMSPQPKANL